MFKICCECHAPRNAKVLRCVNHPGPYRFRNPSRAELARMNESRAAFADGKVIPWQPDGEANG